MNFLEILIFIIVFVPLFYFSLKQSHERYYKTYKREISDFLSHSELTIKEII